MKLQIILAGIGGQGVVYATKTVTQAALLSGERVMACENHGMSQRGGSVMSHVKIGGSAAPLIRRGAADVVLGFDRAEVMRQLTFIRPGGAIYVNSANGLDLALTARLAELGVGVYAVNADGCARELGAPTAINLVVLGFAAAHPAFGLSLEALSAAVRALGPARAVELNLKALAGGAGLKLANPPAPDNASATTVGPL